MLASIAEEEAKSISQNVKWSIQKNFSRGNVHIPTSYFLGYDTDEEGNIVINEEQAKTVRRIYKSFSEGMSTPAIAKELMKDGLLTGRNKKIWTPDSVKKILKNEKFMGHCLTSKSYTTSYLTHERKANDGSFPQYYVKNTHPGIISEDDWYTVQEEIKRRNDLLRDPDRKYKSRFSGVSPLSNTLFCQKCGRPVIRRRMTSSKLGEKYLYTVYQCRAAAGKEPEFKDCNAQYLWEEAIEIAFMQTLFHLKKNLDRVIKESETFITSYEISEEEENELYELEIKIDKVSKRVTELVSKESVSNDTIYDATLRSLIYEQEILELEHERLNKNKQESIYYKSKLKEFIKYLEALDETKDEFRADIYRNIIESGTTYDNTYITFNFNCGVKFKAYAHRDIINK